jgi:hypothetical protein
MIAGSGWFGCLRASVGLGAYGGDCVEAKRVTIATGRLSVGEVAMLTLARPHLRAAPWLWLKGQSTGPSDALSDDLAVVPTYSR